MPVSPPFVIAENLPQLTDLVSQYPPVENTFRDVVESWLNFISDSTTGELRPYSTDSGAGAGPILRLYRDSPSPAASDLIGQFLFQGEDSAGNTENYAAITTRIDDPTSGSEDSTIIFDIKRAGGTMPVLSLTNFNNGAAVLYSDEAGGAGGPTLQLQRDSASPVAGDFLGVISFLGDDSAGNVQNYGYITAVINNPANGSEDSTMTFHTFLNGADTASLSLTGTILTIGGTSGSIGGVARSIGNGTMYISGGSTLGLGAHIELYGESHGLASQAFHDANVHVFRTYVGGFSSSELVRIQGFLALFDAGSGAGVLGSGGGTIILRPNGVANGSGQMTYDTAGNLTAAGNVTAFSDRRLKSDIRELTETGKIIDGIEGKRFTKDGKPGIGFIAQDVQTYLPELVIDSAGLPDDPSYLSLSYGNLTAVLWNEVRSLRYRVAELERK